jgi:recombinational DNA repair protein RecT
MNNQETLNQAHIIQSLKATDVIRNEYVRQQFINVYNAIWKEGGEGAYEREAMYFNNQLRDSENLRKCTGMSVFFAFIDLAVRGLTLEPGAQALCYLLPRSYCTGKNAQGQNLYESRCNLTISGYGELVLRAKAGQIQYADNPVIVYEGDEFSFGEKDGRKYVNYCCRIPRQSDRIIACFLKITRCDGSVDYSVMTEGDWKRLSDFSGKANRYWDNEAHRYVDRPNQLYSSAGGQIDTGFLKAKCIKHAFKTYPKIAIGKGTQLESDVIGNDNQPETGFDPYGGMADNAENPVPKAEQTFAPAPDLSAGVTIDPAAGGNNDDTF